MSNLILLRHAQSIFNLQKRFTGWLDVELTDKGKLDAQNAGKLIKQENINFKTFFTSFQKRAINTLEIVLKELNNKNPQIIKAWELNERHYGALSSLSKDEMTRKHGIQKVKIWRRSWDIAPPPMEKDDPNHPSKHQSYKDIPIKKIPDSESLKDAYERVVPYYDQKIEPLIKKKQNILISAHGNTIRALCKKLFNISKKKIITLEIPTANPLLIKFDNDLKILNYKYLDLKKTRRIFTNI